jgi:hypothetical protein
LQTHEDFMPLTGLDALYNPAAYGSIPQIPLPSETAGGAISGNLGNLGAIYKLAQEVGSASGAGQAAQYGALLPGLAGYLGQAGGNVASELAGQLPADVINQIQQAGAERGIGTGAPGSPNANAAMLKALGLTSLGLEQQGQSDLSRLIGEVPVGPAFNPASMLVTPEQQQEAAAANALYRAAPDPYAAAMANLAAAQYGQPSVSPYSKGGYSIGPGAGGRAAAPMLAPSGAPSFVWGGGGDSGVLGEDQPYIDPETGEVVYPGETPSTLEDLYGGAGSQFSDEDLAAALSGEDYFTGE